MPKAFELTGSNIKATIDNVALSTLIFSVVAIAAVSTVAVTSAEKLIAINEQVLRTQRIVSSLQAIRFQSMLVEMGEQSFVITGNNTDLGSYRSGAVEVDAEINYLSDKRADFPLLNENFESLKSVVSALLKKEKLLVEVRKTQGFAAAQAIARQLNDDVEHEKLLRLTYRMLAETKGRLDQLEVDQLIYGETVRRWIMALISSASLILVFLYGTLRRLNIAQRNAQERMAYLATHDALTGLFNRPAVVEHIETSIGDPATPALGGFTLLLLDLDGFKAVNDTLGHNTGDDLLKQVSTRITSALRDSDYVARLGGDEFLVVLPQLSELEIAQRVAAKLIDVIGKPYILGMRSAEVTVSIGASRFPLDGRDRETLMKCADLALYAAKHNGRNQTKFFAHGVQGAQPLLL